LDGYFPTFGAATSPRHWHVLVFSLSKGKGKQRDEWKDKGQWKKRDRPLSSPLYSFLSSMFNGKNPQITNVFLVVVAQKVGE
jgi:hypothetical protein